jgi:DNA-binding response OmpR family regulator
MNTRENKVGGLTMGGDDHMTKPFHLDELAARGSVPSCGVPGRRRRIRY